ncbi:hypothetical protein [Lentzea sp. E54]|uniref:hypothetical protein n=1 Tax=Lentzea xerophila TaxID=3435883 RepID=UPI003DA6505C
MATTDEIRERIKQADAARSVRRLAAAQRVGELANRRKALASELEEVDLELGAVLAENEDVISVPELAVVTDLSASDLTDWLSRRKTARTKRKRHTDGGTGTKTQTRQAPTPSQASMPPAPRSEAAPAPVLAPVT